MSVTEYLPEQARRVKALREARRLLTNGVYRPPLRDLLALATYICRGDTSR